MHCYDQYISKFVYNKNLAKETWLNDMVKCFETDVMSVNKNSGKWVLKIFESLYIIHHFCTLIFFASTSPICPSELDEQLCSKATNLNSWTGWFSSNKQHKDAITPLTKGFNHFMKTYVSSDLFSIFIHVRCDIQYYDPNVYSALRKIPKSSIYCKAFINQNWKHIIDILSPDKQPGLLGSDTPRKKSYIHQTSFLESTWWPAMFDMGRYFLL